MVSGWWGAILLGVIALIVLSLVYLAMRRTLILGSGLGRGFVEVTESEISYFSETEGGTVSLDAIFKVVLSTETGGLDPTQHYWILYHNHDVPLVIPGNASGSVSLLNALSTLSGINLHEVLRVRAKGMRGVFTIWEKDMPLVTRA